MASSLVVVIPTHGRPDLLKRTLDSLAACDKPSIYRETVVVENGPKQGAEAIVQAHASDLKARYMHVSVANKSHALNCVLETLGDDLICFLDDDVRLDTGVLQAYASAAQGTDRGSYYGGPVGVDYEKKPPEWLVSYLPASARGWSLNEHSDQSLRGRFLGFNWTAFACDLRELGGFDANRGPGTSSTGQESDMQRRLFDAGMVPVYVANAMVWHYVPSERCSARWTLRRSYRNGINQGMRLGEGESSWIDSPYRARVRWVRKLLKAGRAMVLRDPMEKFAAMYDLCKYSGVLRGYRRKRISQ